jgi:hypothetical protein
MKNLEADINKIQKHCSDFLKKTENDIEKEIQLVNWLENKILFMKKNIIDRIEKSNRIRNISKIQINKIIETLNLKKNEVKGISTQLQNSKYLISNNFIKVEDKTKSYIKANSKSNLDIEEDESLEKWIGKEFNVEKRRKYISSEIIPEEEVDLGFGNTYIMKTIESLDKTNIDYIPYDTLIYDKHTSQVVIKIGNGQSFRIINSKLCKVYYGKSSNDNTRSIICNNIINSNANCNTKTCNYYHDPYLGKYDDFHTERQFSNNPIVFSNKDNNVCHTFKSGDCVKDNVKKIDWHDAITLYQSSLSNILISCIHSQKNI